MNVYNQLVNMIWEDGVGFRPNGLAQVAESMGSPELHEHLSAEQRSHIMEIIAVIGRNLPQNWNAEQHDLKDAFCSRFNIATDNWRDFFLTLLELPEGNNSLLNRFKIGLFCVCLGRYAQNNQNPG
ncbi:MAG: hypothetical protein H7A36_04965 [Chlamydiales bacterium]|nr:hypothetical protein [Chlamydiales bacterium]